MELFTIHASKDGDWVETQDTSPTLTVAKGEHPSQNRMGRAHHGLRRQTVWTDQVQ